MRDSITYHLPGGLHIRYSGDPKPLHRWVKATWRSYLTAWRVWITIARLEMMAGNLPNPWVVSAKWYAVVKAVMNKMGDI